MDDEIRGMTTIRRALPDDAQSLARLAELTFRDTFESANDPADIDLHCARSFGEEIQRREILDPNYISLLAECEGRLVAFAQIRLHSRTECLRAERPFELYRLYVMRNWHGRGVAQEVMSEVLVAAARDGADSIWLGVWEENPKAIAFYRKHGFEVVGDHVFQFGTDPQRDLVMALPIEEQSVGQLPKGRETSE